MNAARRKQISQAADLISEAFGLLEQISSDEDEYLEAMPESLRDGEKGERAQAAIDALGEASNSLDDALAYLAGAL